MNYSDNLAMIAVEACKKINPDNPLIVAESIIEMVNSLKKSPKYHTCSTSWDKEGHMINEEFDNHAVLRKILPAPKLTIHNRDGSKTIVEPIKSCPGWGGY